MKTTIKYLIALTSFLYAMLGYTAPLSQDENSYVVNLDLAFDGNCGLLINWGDGSEDKIRVGFDVEKKFTLRHDFKKAGNFVVQLKGKGIFRGLKSVTACKISNDRLAIQVSDPKEAEANNYAEQLRRLDERTFCLNEYQKVLPDHLKQVVDAESARRSLDCAVLIADIRQQEERARQLREKEKAEQAAKAAKAERDRVAAEKAKELAAKEKELAGFRKAASDFAKKSKTDWSLTDEKDEMSGARKVYATAVHRAGLALVESKLSCDGKAVNAQFTVSIGSYPISYARNNNDLAALAGMGCIMRGKEYWVNGRLKVNDNLKDHAFCVSQRYRNVVEILWAGGDTLPKFENEIWGAMIELPTSEGPVIFYLPSTDPALKEVYKACM